MSGRGKSSSNLAPVGSFYAIALLYFSHTSLCYSDQRSIKRFAGERFHQLDQLLTLITPLIAACSGANPETRAAAGACPRALRESHRYAARLALLRD